MNGMEEIEKGMQKVKKKNTKISQSIFEGNNQKKKSNNNNNVKNGNKKKRQPKKKVNGNIY